MSCCSGAGLHLFMDGGKGGLAVDFRLTGTEQIQVRPVQHQNALLIPSDRFGAFTRCWLRHKREFAANDRILSSKTGCAGRCLEQGQYLFGQIFFA